MSQLGFFGTFFIKKKKCVRACWCVCVMCIWRSEVGIRCLPWLLFTLIFENGSLSAGSSLTGWTASSQHLPVLTHPSLSAQVVCDFLPECWGSKLRSSHACNTHLTDRAISTAHVFSSFAHILLLCGRQLYYYLVKSQPLSR